MQYREVVCVVGAWSKRYKGIQAERSRIGESEVDT